MPQITTITRGGSRWYVHPETGVKYPGVTSIVGMLPKPFLTPWAAKMTAEAAVDNLAAVTSIAERDRDGAVDYLKGAHRRYTKARADVGSMAHDAFERLMRGEDVGRVHPDITQHVEYFRQFMGRVNPELVRAEEIAWSDEHQYAGSFDAVLRVWLDDTGRLMPTRGDGSTPHLLMVDYKTSASTYPDVALQLAAYAHAEKLIDADGTESPMPYCDGAAVLHITESGWAFKPVDVSWKVFQQFIFLRHTLTWDREVSKTVLGKPLASGGKLVTGTQRRAA